MRRLVALAVAGFLLMFVAHVGAFTASTFVPNVPLPYWWAYPVLYPAVVVLAVRRGWFPPWLATCAVCLPPAAYFVVIGLADSDWGASDTAIVGVGLAVVVALILGTWSVRRASPPH